MKITIYLQNVRGWVWKIVFFRGRPSNLYTSMRGKSCKQAPTTKSPRKQLNIFKLVDFYIRKYFYGWRNVISFCSSRFRHQKYTVLLSITAIHVRPIWIVLFNVYTRKFHHHYLKYYSYNHSCRYHRLRCLGASLGPQTQAIPHPLNTNFIDFTVYIYVCNCVY